MFMQNTWLEPIFLTNIFCIIAIGKSNNALKMMVYLSTLAYLLYSTSDLRHIPYTTLWNYIKHVVLQL